MNLPKIFATHLKLQGTSPVSIRNYCSDLRHFLGWLELTLRSHNLPLLENEEERIKVYFTSRVVSEYKKFLLANNLPLSTVNRRLSTLRSLGKFCLSNAWLENNPALTVTNLARERTQGRNHEQILEKFQQYLEKEKSSTNTIKNYLSDMKAFLAWAEVTP